MDPREFKVYYKVNTSDEFPGDVIKVKTSDYVKIKHCNINFSYNFLINYFKQEQLYSEDDIDRLWISIDDVEYTIIYDRINPVKSDIENQSDSVRQVNKINNNDLLSSSKNEKNKKDSAQDNSSSTTCCQK